MTLVELVVVLSIFAIMTSVVMFNYKTYEAKVDIKNLASDIALQIVDAQKSAANGKLNSSAGSGWVPEYGVYFKTATSPTKFAEFADLNSSDNCSSSNCSNFSVGGEVTNVVSISKGSYISEVDYYVGASKNKVSGDFNIVFKRPSYSACFTTSGSCISNVDHTEILVYSQLGQGGPSATIQIYPSGRIQIQ